MMNSDLQTVLDDIDSIRTALLDQKRWEDGEWLYRAIIKLAALVTFLGPQVASAENDADTMEAHYKTTRESRKLELIKSKEKLSATQAESQAYVDTESELQNWNKAKYNHKLLSIKRTDSNNLVDAMRSGLSYLRQERDKS